MSAATSSPRVMLLAPQYWISGTVTLARQMQRGWPSDWSTPPIACPTKSGRASTQWGRAASRIMRATSTTWQPDITGTADDIVDLAKQSFDFVHITEPDISKTSRHWWHDLLDRLPIPWSLTLNGNVYPNVQWQRIIDAPNFSGVVWRTPGNVPAELLHARHKIRIIPLARPYVMQHSVAAQLPRVRCDVFLNDVPIIGTHCRIAPDKGTASIAALAKHIGANVCIDGASQAGAMPYALMLQQSVLDESERVAAHKSWTTRPMPGQVHYHGAFSDGVLTALHHDVHVSNTRLGFSAGHEYSLLEAIDAGCVIVQPTHMIERECSLRQFTFPWIRYGTIGAFNHAHEPLAHAVKAALRASTSCYDQSTNRALIAAHHDPEQLIRTFYSEIMSTV